MIGPFRGQYRFLSNFFPAMIMMDGIFYPTVEHAYQASKTEHHLERVEIRDAPTAGIARRRGKALGPVLSGWLSRRLDIMYGLVHQKFFAHRHLGDFLLETREEDLVEVNTWNDTYWGVCKGVGQNHLGKILMRVRAELKESKRGQ